MGKQMRDFIVIVENEADKRTATKLAERVVADKVDWAVPEILQDVFRWGGLEEHAEYSCWKNIGDAIEHAKDSGIRIPRFLGHGKTGLLKTDGANTKKVLILIGKLRQEQNRQIDAVLFIRDLDDQPERRTHIEAVRDEHIGQHPKLAIIIGTPYRTREAWVLNGFIPSTPDEAKTLEELKAALSFDPCEEAHRLGAKSRQEPDRLRNPKVVLETLTGNDYSREQQCWEETSLNVLRARGTHTGLATYLDEIKEHLVPIICGGS